MPCNGNFGGLAGKIHPGDMEGTEDKGRKVIAAIHAAREADIENLSKAA